MGQLEGWDFPGKYSLEVGTKKSRFNQTQIVSVQIKADVGVPVIDICRKHGIRSPTYYKWKPKYGGQEGELKRIKELEAENGKLKRMYADKTMEAD